MIMRPIPEGQRTIHGLFTSCPPALMLIAGLSWAPTSQAQERPAAARGEVRGQPPSASLTHVVTAEAEYYTTGPQPARPPDGRFPAGTRVALIRESGSYALVRSAEGVRAYVAAAALQPIDGEAGARRAAVRAVVEGNNRFALDLYARLRTGGSGNLFFSPGSLSTALAMTSAGARGRTAEQMAEVLHFRLPQEELHRAFAALQVTWAADGQEAGYRLSVANRLWGQEGFDFRPAFLATTREHYGAELAQVDFARQAEQSRRWINAWVKEQTQGKIRDLIPPGVLDAMTRLVLTNAIYFKGDWTEPFRKEATQEAPFHVSARQQANVLLMHRQDDLRYWAGDGLKVLELPYGKGNLAMVVLLPDEVEELADLEDQLTSENLTRWLSGLRKQEVRVSLPRFTLTWQFQLADVLKAMGMDRAFTPGEADLSGMSSEEELFLSAVIHKSFVDVNEEGTEAAAATGVAVKAVSAIPEGPVEFRADHPFVFLIRDNRTGSLLFLGRLRNPRG
jgi:serpin B